MIRFPIQFLVLSVIAVSSVIAIKGYDNDFMSFVVKADQCFSHSGDQELCDNYIDCKKNLPKPLYDAYMTCIHKIYPGGTLGKCNDKETLFGTPDQFHKKSDLSDDQKKQFDDYKECTHKLYQDCMKENGMQS
ncbi:uncharacterized protein TNCT_103961 [Trichonephila clavata]|uniref:Uncharacterized protein n=1 Tax=Trichonephila clavata TaxID=2740835 RepID=A0A8X6H6J0_TRICU|nr:uncharacterized protein TNCT_103961 [Trichonephila clavata]